MVDRPSDPEQNAIPEDIATLYSRAHLRGSRYWDFSASRSEVRGQFGHRIVREPAGRGQATQPAVAPARQPGGQEQAPQGETPPAKNPQLEPQASAGPAGAARIEPYAETHKVRELTNSQAALPETLAGPMTGGLPQPRQGLAGRWYALHSVLAPAEVAVAAPLASPPTRLEEPPMVAVFSLAGGVGKTCLVATLGRALAALGEHVLLVETAAWGLLPLYFGSREFKRGVVRTFSPPGAESGSPVHVLSLEVERYNAERGERDPLLEELERDGRGASRILVDLATASRQVPKRLLVLRPTVLIPILPDMSSVASLVSLKAFLSNRPDPASLPSREGERGGALYLLNQFDASLPLHLDLREMLQRQLGDRLLPFVLRRSSAVSEALAEGMTVIDYAPDSAAAEDYRNLAGWLRSVAAPAGVRHRGVRWSER